MEKMTKITLFAACAVAVAGCEKKDEMVSLGIDDSYVVPRMQKLYLSPAYTGQGYRWGMKLADGRDSILSTDKDYIFLIGDEGVYDLSFDLLDPVNPYHHDFKVMVVHEETEYSAYIAKVYDYCPAPGQFINEIPQYEPGDSYQRIIEKVEESICDKNDELISLGGWGGYIIFGFDHTVINSPGLDFMIYGNAFYELTDPDGRGGSAEPGIVYVAYDSNMNGKPDDDEWYELAGSEYFKPSTIHDYEITYNRPDPSKPPVEDDRGFLSDIEYIPWSDNRGGTGFIAKNIYHDQEYYPKWVNQERLSFSGTLLPQNAVDASGMGTYYILYSYDWGYVDNHPNDYRDLCSFDISWAVDKSGRKVHLPGVDFIKVMTGVNQYCGWLGETSTELSKAEDLNLTRQPPLPDPLNN